MAIVSNFDNLFTPDVNLREAAPSPSITAAPVGIVGVVGQATRGPVGVPTRVTSLTDWVRKFGGYDAAQAGEGYMFMYNLFRSGATTVDFVRITDGNEAAATASVNGSVFELTQPGSFGNSVSLTISANSVTGFVDILFRNGAETYEYKAVTFTDSDSSRYIVKVLEAAEQTDGFVNITTVGVSNPATGTVLFTGGSNGTVQGTSLLDSAYVGQNTGNGLTGLVAMESTDDVEILVCSRANDAISNALKDHVSLSTVSPRIAVCSPAQGTQVTNLANFMQSFNSDRCVMTFPFLQILNPNNNKKEYHSPTAFYAGLLSTLSYHISPSRNIVNGVIGTERALTRGEVDTLSRNRVSPITLLSGFGFVVRNGYNTSNLPSLANITRRRAVNFFAKTFESGLQQFVSRPHTSGLRTDVVSVLSNLLQNEVNLGKIGQVNGGSAFAVKCDAQNNPLSVVQQGQLIVDIQISLWSPADFINVTLDASEAKVITIG